MSILKKDINPRMRASEPNLRHVNDQGEISVLFAPISENIESEANNSQSEFEWNYSNDASNFIVSIYNARKFSSTLNIYYFSNLILKCYFVNFILRIFKKDYF